MPCPPTCHAAYRASYYAEYHATQQARWSDGTTIATGAIGVPGRRGLGCGISGSVAGHEGCPICCRSCTS